MTSLGAERLVSAKQRARMGSLRDVIGHLPPLVRLVGKAGRGMALVVLLLIALQGPLPALQLWVTQRIMDILALLAGGKAASAREVLGLCWPYVVAGLLVTLLSQGMGQIQGLVLGLLGQRVTHHLSQRILERAGAVDYAKFEQPDFYDQLQRAQQDSATRSPQLLGVLAGLLQQALVTASLITLLFRLEPMVTLLLGACIVPQVMLLSRMARLNYQMMWGQTPLARRLAYLASLLISRDAAKEVRLFRLVQHFLAEHALLFREQYRRFRDLQARRVLAILALGLLTALGYSSVIAMLISRVAQGRISLGAFVFASGAFVACQGSVVTVVGLVIQLYESMLFLDNVFAFLRPSPPRLPKPVPAASGRAGRGASIEFSNVGFTYPGQARPALNGVSLRIAAGEIVAVVGENGAGKSTLVKLLCDLYQPSAGQVLLDGVPLTEHEDGAVSRKLAVIFQDYVSYWASVRDNIGYGAVERLKDELGIQAVARRSGVHAIADRLSQGYDTILTRFSEGGTHLSQGQWQLVALSRALFHAGGVLILDEPTASLDPRSEYELFRELRALADGRTVILISHRFSTVRVADRILVLKDGRVAEDGSHSELLALGGHYAQMFDLQAVGYR